MRLPQWLGSELEDASAPAPAYTSDSKTSTVHFVLGVILLAVSALCMHVHYDNYIYAWLRHGMSVYMVIT